MLEPVILLAVLSLLVVACTPRADGSADATGTPGSSATTFETPGSPSTGAWQVLFDGTSLDHFRGYDQVAFPADRWVVEGDTLRAVPGAGIDLITRDTYVDFELEFEWRVAPGGNSGVIYRVLETPAPAWMTGPEYQVLDDTAHPDGLRPETSAGALYDLLAPADKRLEPVGEFNTGRIVVREGRVEHWLNGALVVAYGWGDPAMRAVIGASKFADADGFMRQPSGHIVLQHHGEEAWFRAVRIRKLD